MAHEFNVPFASPYMQTAPIPGVHAEPMERLLQSLLRNHVVFICRAEEEGADWLNAPRLHRFLQQSLMEPAQTEIWPLLSNTWAITLDMEAAADQPDQSLNIHSLRRAFIERLEAGWRAEKGLSLPSICDDLQATVNTADFSIEALTEETPAVFPSASVPAGFTLTPIAPLRAMSDMEDNISELNALLNVIVNKQLHAQFQPIVSLRDGQIFGYEALIRGPKGGALRRPGALYRAAEKARMVSWFDLACQEQCFARAAELGLKHHLFINMEAEGLSFMDMHERPLAVRARECGLNPASIVIEITERQAVDDFPRLMQSLERLREQGFKVAVDDAGAGYNSLSAIAELRPDFVKIDRSLVRNLDVNGAHRALLSTLVAYARNIGTHILAEGSETREELATLIDLGVTYGQGYLMGKPADTFRGVTRETREFIQARHLQRAQMEVGRSMTVGSLSRPAKIMEPDTPLAEAAAKFYRNPSLTSVVVAEDGFARGLLMRHSLEHILELACSAQMEGFIPDETVAQWMQTTMLCVGEEEAATDVARQATTREDVSLEADIVVVDGVGRCAGVLPMRVLVEAVASIQVNRSRYADPLTGLPSRVALEQIVAERLEARSPLAFARIDLTGLEHYNRANGVPQGDHVLRSLTNMLQTVLHAQAGGDPFLAHLGGDDFVFVIHPDRVANACEALVQQFEREKSRFYSHEQARSGCMQVAERNGNTRRVPLLACRVAAVTNRSRRFACFSHLLDEAHSLLRQLKAHPDSNYAIDGAQANHHRKSA